MTLIYPNVITLMKPDYASCFALCNIGDHVFINNYY
nr:MAG TPA: hypothetical protein [Caudoviricetes sp.]DAT36830.1 MAG TPA: hypothetical protein [Caudoviricetes sp.]DAW88629.1 MAG TPA: hypothetical protein [Caudoviricetes sp.]